ncbi:MAG: glutamine synthetase III [Clostridiales bacterium]|nr:glutamine synthetase III [Clostridiales bacterium]MDR2750420.1 glutamine synthetase III [Clostridiales bacterium]
MKSVPELYGSLVFNDTVMQARLPKDTYRALKKTISQGTHLDLDVANVVASVMKDWAVEKGATHFTHWFQPMTGITAEKHDSFISPDGSKVIMEFSGKELVRGEPDASSFPSGGLRATFEARGYTAWDPTSYAFLKDDSLCIPTAFCSYGGQALDKKTPLLRSMDALSIQALRILRLFGDKTTKRVNTTVGPEQEYFLISKESFLKRPDLVYTGRTLIGSRPPKGQELEDHYFVSIKSKVSSFMKDLDTELWKLGIPAKTKHNEVAPAQHEMAPIFETTNVGTDHNQLVMELMKSIAGKHGLACLLHEKPFAGVNGSGKHNNWSLATDKGANLLDPGDNPSDQFMLFLAAIIKAVDVYQDLLRVTVASAGNDHRLGANEAPPAIVSIFVGEELQDILDAVEKGEIYHGKEKTQMEIGPKVLPHFPKDTTDRNRTSPFAFTGNKFEFRMVGSSSSIAEPNTILNTIVAEILSEFADKLEPSTNFHDDLFVLLKETITAHKRIIFNGNNYAEDWVTEAEARGLSNLKTTIESLPSLVTPESIAVLTKHKVLAEEEIHSRYEIMLENYCKTVHIEALTMVDMVRQEVFPAVIAYERELANLIDKKGGKYNVKLEDTLLTKLSDLTASASLKLDALEASLLNAKSVEGALALATFYRYTVFNNMSELRLVVDEMETLVSKDRWPYPSYGDLLFSVLH